MIKYDYNKDTMTVDGAEYQLDPYRKWLVRNHEQLCVGHFVKAIRSGGETKMTFDWQSIFLKAEEYQFIKDYVYEINPKGPSPVPRDLSSDREVK